MLSRDFVLLNTYFSKNVCEASVTEMRNQRSGTIISAFWEPDKPRYQKDQILEIVQGCPEHQKHDREHFPAVRHRVCKHALWYAG